jgi:hypothetical protein
MSAIAPPAARREVSSKVGPQITDEGKGCDVCPHLVGDHDAIGLRFCRATRSTGVDRSCVCR